MAQNPETEKNESGAGELRGPLIKRLAVAGVLVALLLGMLAFFDYLATAPDEQDAQEARVFTKPVPVAPKKEVSQPVTPAENLPEPPTPEPVVEPPPPPVVETLPPPEPAAKATARPEIRPQTPSTVTVTKVPPAAATGLPVRPPRAAPEESAPPETRREEPVSAPLPVPAKPSARVIEPKPAPAVIPPSAPRLFSGFVLQAGVFYSPLRAEELHAKLILSGVPSTLETRVQVGPFRTRQEAEAAQAKLKSMGVETILVPPKGGRP